MQADRVDVRTLQIGDKDGKLLQVTGRAGVSLAERQVGDVDLRVTSDDFSVLDGNFGRLHLDTNVAVQRHAAGAPRRRDRHRRLRPHRGRQRAGGAAPGQGRRGDRRGGGAVAVVVEPAAIRRGGHRLSRRSRRSPPPRRRPRLSRRRSRPRPRPRRPSIVDAHGPRPAREGAEHADPARRWREDRRGRAVARQPEHDAGRRPARDQGGRRLDDGGRHRQHGPRLLRVPGPPLRAASRRHGQLQGPGPDQPAAERHGDARRVRRRSARPRARRGAAAGARAVEHAAARRGRHPVADHLQPARSTTSAKARRRRWRSGPDRWSAASSRRPSPRRCAMPSTSTCWRSRRSRTRAVPASRSATRSASASS